jgi:hypothetical protein
LQVRLLPELAGDEDHLFWVELPATSVLSVSGSVPILSNAIAAARSNTIATAAAMRHLLERRQESPKLAYFLVQCRTGPQLEQPRGQGLRRSHRHISDHDIYLNQRFHGTGLGRPDVCCLGGL